MIREISARDNLKMKQIIQARLAENDLAIPGTAYFDPELANLAAFYAARKNRCYFVLTNDRDEVIGGAGIAEYGETNEIAELQKLYLATAAQGQGASYQLMARAIAFAKSAGYQTLYLETHHNLAAAVHIYEKIGFEKLAAPLQVAQHNTMDLFYVLNLKA